MAKPTKPTKPTKTADAVEKDGYDVYQYGSALKALPDLGALETEGTSKNGFFSALLSDVYASLYKSQPKLLGAEETEAPEAHRRLVEQVMTSLDYDKLRQTTRLSAAASAYGTLELGETLLGKLPEGEPKSDTHPDGWEYLEGCSDESEQGTMVRRLVRQAKQRTAETMETMQALGYGTEAGSATGGADLAHVAELSRQLRQSDQLRRIAALAGRMRRLALAKRAQHVRGLPEEIVGVELGRDMTRALPAELALLATPLRDTVLLRWAQGALLQFELEATERLSEGPIVVCIDSSGSMSGERDTWAKAVALGLMAIAQREERAFGVVFFGSRHELRTFNFGVRPKFDAVLACLGTFFGGGTDFEAPLREAFRLIGSTESELAKADLVFLTDGQCALSDEYQAEAKDFMARTGTHLYTVYIQSPGGSLDPLSDGVAHLSQLSEDEATLDLVFGI